jgi:hypothetical protein
MLQCVCEQLYDKNLGGLSREKLKAVRNAKPEADIILDLAPCNPCKDFGRLLKEITGIHFSIHVNPNILQRLMPMGNRQTKLRRVQMNAESMVDETYENHQMDYQMNYQHLGSASSWERKEKRKNPPLPRAQSGAARNCTPSNLRDSHKIPSSRSMRITKLQQDQAKVRRSSFKPEPFSHGHSLSPSKAETSGLQRGARVEKSYWRKFAQEEFVKFTASTSKSKSDFRNLAEEESLKFTAGRPEGPTTKITDLQKFAEEEFLKFASNLKLDDSKAPPRPKPASKFSRFRPFPRAVTPNPNSSSLNASKASPEAVVSINKFRYTPSPISKARKPKLFRSPPVPFKGYRDM